MTQSFDSIIVGAGPVGCVLANRHTEDGTRGVLLIASASDGPPTCPGSPGMRNRLRP